MKTLFFLLFLSSYKELYALSSISQSRVQCCQDRDDATLASNRHHCQLRRSNSLNEEHFEKLLKKFQQNTESRRRDEEEERKKRARDET